MLIQTTHTAKGVCEDLLKPSVQLSDSNLRHHVRKITQIKSNCLWFALQAVIPAWIMDSVCDFYGQNEMVWWRLLWFGASLGFVAVIFPQQRATGGSFPGWFLPFKPACHD